MVINGNIDELMEYIESNFERVPLHMRCCENWIRSFRKDINHLALVFLNETQNVELCFKNGYRLTIEHDRFLNDYEFEITELQYPKKIDINFRFENIQAARSMPELYDDFLKDLYSYLEYYRYENENMVIRVIP